MILIVDYAGLVHVGEMESFECRFFAEE